MMRCGGSRLLEALHETFWATVEGDSVLGFFSKQFVRDWSMFI